jgi:hypothetical protein
LLLAFLLLLQLNGAAGATIASTTAYQNCLASPGTCTSLALGSSSLTGTIPSELGTLTELEALYLDDNQLTGTIPVELAALTELEALYLDDNQLTGTIPSELGTVTTIQLLHLDTNQLTGTIPSELAAIPAMLQVRDNAGLCGVVPAGVSATTSRTDLGNECPPTASPTASAIITSSPTIRRPPPPRHAAQQHLQILIFSI